MDLVVVVSDLMEVDNFHYQLVNGVVYSVDNSSSRYTDNKNIYVLVLRDGPTDG